MPELPEVETVRRALHPRLRGRRVLSAQVRRRALRDPLPPNLARALAGQTILRVRRRAKYLLFETTGQTMLAHLGMTGVFSFAAAPPTGKHAHLVFALDDGAYLVYTDPRRFGRVTLTARAAAHPWLRGLGPEPLTAAFNGAALALALRGKSAPIKTALMDSRVVAGIGNIYASEALFFAGINPRAPAGGLRAARLARLTAAIKGVLRRAVRAGGSTLRDFVGGDGKPGYFQHEWAVYGRGGMPCGACGAAVQKIAQSGRATYFCPRCQR